MRSCSAFVRYGTTSVEVVVLEEEVDMKSSFQHCSTESYPVASEKAGAKDEKRNLRLTIGEIRDLDFELGLEPRRDSCHRLKQRTRPSFTSILGALALASASMLLLTSLLNTAWLTSAALALPHNGDDSQSQISPDADGKYTLVSEGIRAQFIPYGASITNLFINDTSGVERDIVLGFDNATYYSEDKSHPHLGGVPGRYANRIKNR